MFKELINEAKINISLELEAPLCIKTGDADVFNPNLPDMQCVKTYKNGQLVYLIPGSSFKGVVRSRFEKLLKLFGSEPCNIHNNRKNSCSDKLWGKEEKGNDRGKRIYNRVCGACKIFGSGNISSRIKFRDFYPDEDYKVKTSIRNGVGINRITGAAQQGALYEYEVVDSAKFKSEIILNNFEVKYLKILMYILRDIDEGYLSFGSASSRGNGNMKISDLSIELIQYKKDSDDDYNKYKEYILKDLWEMEESDRFAGISNYKCYSGSLNKENLCMYDFIKKHFNNIEYKGA